MAATRVTWSFIDRQGQKGYAGFKTPSTVGIAEAEAFVTALAPYSEGLKNNVGVETVVEYNPDPLLTPGDQPSDFSGTVIVENTTTLKTYPLTVPALISTVIISQPGGDKLTLAAEQAIAAAFATATGEVVAIKRSFTQNRQN